MVGLCNRLPVPVLRLFSLPRHRKGGLAKRKGFDKEGWIIGYGGFYGTGPKGWKKTGFVARLA